MNLYFDPDFDAGAWPGPLGLGVRSAAAGESWVGPAGLLNAVETAVGARVPFTPESRRMAQLARAAGATEGFWSASAALDPLGVARRLLSWADTLRLHGWRGQPVTPRVAQLAGLLGAVEAGFAERLQAAADAAQERDTPIRSLLSFEPLEQLPATLRRLLDGLRARGTSVEVHPQGAAVASLESDLSQARGGAPFLPRGDGSLQIVRPYGTLEAADSVAAALATSSSLEGTVLIGGSPALDAALRRHGLPVLGARPPAVDNALLQLLPLTLAMGFGPQDPQRALELLTLPASPVPRGFARRLARALHQAPAVDSDLWRDELARSLERYAEEGGAEERAEAVAERLKVLFGPGTRTGRLPLENVRARTRLLSRWLHGRTAVEEKGGRDASAWHAALAQLSAFEVLVDLSGVGELPPALVARFVEEATRAAPPPLGAQAECGPGRVQSPGAIAGRCERAIWWDFDLDAARRPPPLPFTDAELAALRGAGVELPSRSALSIAEAARWRRPLLMAARQLVLVCPRRTGSGDERHPHPLWDELSCKVAGGAQREAALGRLVVAAMAGEGGVAPAASARPPLPLPVAVRTHAVDPALIARREKDSPSSVGTLISCAMKWTLEYLGKVRGGGTARLPAAQQLLGNVSHELLATVLSEAPAATPEEAQARAERLFDEEGPRLAAPLFLPGADAQRGQARSALGRSARELFSLMRDGRLKVSSVEQPFSREALGTRLEGTPDLVVETPGGGKAIIDLKWSGLGYRRRSLIDGTAHQLAAYGFLLEDAAQPALPPGGYFIINQQVLLTTSPETFPHAVRLTGPDQDDTWRATVAAQAKAWGRLEQGVVEVGAVDEAGRRREKEDEEVRDGVLALEPPCTFCDYSAVCGAAYARSAEKEEAA